MLRMIRWIWLPLLAVLCVSVALAPKRALAGAVPLPPGAPWFNVSRPLTPNDLKGRVVLLDFFTPGCINCVHMLPDMARLEREFGARLLILGVNSPKFVASQRSSNIEGFIQRYDITHPVLTDKGMTLWNYYGVQAWPTLVLLNGQGGVVQQFIGEGDYRGIRAAVLQTIEQAQRAGTLVTAPLPLKPPLLSRAGLLQPGKVAVDARYVAVSDSGHNRVILLDHAGKVLRVFGSGVPGARDGAAGVAQFDGPQGLAFVGGALYVADTSNSLIRRIDLASGVVSTVAGDGRRVFGGSGMQPARSVPLNSPWGLEAVGDVLYVAMAGDHQVWAFDLRSDRIGPYAGTGAEGIDDGSRQSASFAQSSGFAYHAGTLYVADPESSSVRAIDLKTGRVRTLIGKGLFDFGLRNGRAGQALLQHDQGLAWQGGKLYIADTFNNAVRVLDPANDQVSTLATGLKQPGGLAVLDAGTLLVADTDANRIVTINVANGALHAWPLSGLPPAQ